MCGFDEDFWYGLDVIILVMVFVSVMIIVLLVIWEVGVVVGLDVVLLMLDEVLGINGYWVFDCVEDGVWVLLGEVFMMLEV